ncbi:MAG: HAMP domain-containing histidine kinase, partial [Candidatus Cloacimonetes bacterium]|nr:HAMP domain-containing histidine kinase [Candidatus Cloacimonadota bacterium]
TLFLIIYIASVMILQSFFLKQQRAIDQKFSNMQPDEVLPKLEFKTSADSTSARDFIYSFRESLASVKMIQHETQFYSVLFLVVVMLVSVGVFAFVFYRITNPLKELEKATAKIRQGDFDVFLPETGLGELKQLKQSFNEMSRELEQTQNRLLQAEKEMIWKELSRILAHEIKNPLTPINLAVERLEEKYELDRQKFVEIFPEASRMIKMEIKNLRDLVQSFSSFAKISTPVQSVFDPAESIREMIKPYNHQYNIKLNMLEHHRIRFDETHFYQIFTNLFQNAIEVSNEEKPILINLRQSRSYLVLEIIDEGMGIAPEDMPRIFEPYFTKKKRGTGLGLALVKRLSQANNAVIRAQSDLGKGSKFELIMEDILERSDY